MKRLYAETVGGTDTIEDALEQTERHMSDEDMQFSDRLYEGVHESYAKDWSITRIAKVDLSILRIAVYELLYESNIPQGATVNEAVELAKLFGGDRSPGFVNGILGAIAKDL